MKEPADLRILLGSHGGAYGKVRCALAVEVEEGALSKSVWRGTSTWGNAQRCRSNVKGTFRFHIYVAADQVPLMFHLSTFPPSFLTFIKVPSPRQPTLLTVITISKSGLQHFFHLHFAPTVGFPIGLGSGQLHHTRWCHYYSIRGQNRYTEA